MTTRSPNSIQSNKRKNRRSRQALCVWCDVQDLPPPLSIATALSWMWEKRLYVHMYVHLLCPSAAAAASSSIHSYFLAQRFLVSIKRVKSRTGDQSILNGPHSSAEDLQSYVTSKTLSALHKVFVVAIPILKGLSRVADYIKKSLVLNCCWWNMSSQKIDGTLIRKKNRWCFWVYLLNV
jgi:hypothetical protein